MWSSIVQGNKGMTKKAMILVLAMAPVLARAEGVKVDYEKELSKLTAKNLYDLDPKIKESSLSLLSKLKYFEIKKRWKECAALGPKVANTNKDLRGWVLLSWIKCENKFAEGSKDKKNLNRPLEWLHKHKEVLSEGPWKSALWQEYVQTSLAYLDLNRDPARIADLLDTPDLTKDARSTLYGYLGDLAQKNKKWTEALYDYEQSFQAKDNKTSRDKFEGVKSALGEKFVLSLTQEPGAETEGAEAALEEKMQNDLKAGNLLNALKSAVVIETDYAGSRVARRLKDKPLEIYQQIQGKADSDEKNEKVFREIEKIDATRLAEWAQTFHRRSDYNQALIFAESALKNLYQTPQATNLYWIAGRSAHFLGEYDRALMHFAKLIEFHAGTDEAAEALFRSGLISFRQKNYTAAVTQLDKLLAQKRERYDLLARYWLVRSLENTDKARASTEGKALSDRYPFSYYGLRLAAEAGNGEFHWPEAKPEVPKDSGIVWLVGDQKKAWSRFKMLTQAGWILEAQSEAQFFPASKMPWLEYHFSKLMAKCFQYPFAIRAMNESMELEDSLRTPDDIRVIFPMTFSPWIDSESKKYSLNPWLVRSLIRQESAYGIKALSQSNAQGLMQLIPPTAQDVARRLGMKHLDIPDDIFRPEVNIPLGTFYISSMLDQFSDNVPFALGAYNVGPGKMRVFIESRPEIKDLLNRVSSSPIDELWMDELPWTETSFYVKAILRNSLLYKITYGEKIDWNLALWADLHNKKANIK